MALGVVVRLIMLPTTMSITVGELAAAEMLLRVGGNPSRTRLRLMCSTTLSFLAGSSSMPPAGDGENTKSVSHARARSHGSSTRCRPREDAGRARACARAHRAVVGCRRIALLAMASTQVPLLLETGAPAAVLDLAP